MQTVITSNGRSREAALPGMGIALPTATRFPDVWQSIPATTRVPANAIDATDRKLPFLAPPEKDEFTRPRLGPKYSSIGKSQLSLRDRIKLLGGNTGPRGEIAPKPITPDREPVVDELANLIAATFALPKPAPRCELDSNATGSCDENVDYETAAQRRKRLEKEYFDAR